MDSKWGAVMSILFLLFICITSALDIYASDSESGVNHGGAIELHSVVGTPVHSDHEVVLNMNQFEQSLPGSSTHPLLALNLKSNKPVAQYLTQIAQGSTSAAPSHLTPHILTILKKMKAEDPLKHQHILSELTQHRTRAITRAQHITRTLRGISIDDEQDEHAPAPSSAAPAAHDPTTLSSALQENVPASALRLITQASEASHAQQVSINDAQAVTLREQKVKFWATLFVGGATTLAASAVAIIQALHVTL